MTRRCPLIPRAGYKRAGRRASKRLLALGARLQAPLNVRLGPQVHLPPGDDVSDARKLGPAAAARHSEGVAGGSDPRVADRRAGMPGDDKRMAGGGSAIGHASEAAALRAEIAELEQTQGAAPEWGAAVGAREERLRHLRGRLLDLDPRMTSGGKGER